MENNFLTVKSDMETFFDKEGIVHAVTKLTGKDKEIKLSESFKEGDLVALWGISKGKGFAGGVKRYSFKGGPRTHGQSDRERGPGSIGSTTTPGRVLKGKRMAGRTGSDRVTVKNLLVMKIDDENNVLYIKGAVPGRKGRIISFIEK